MVLSDPTKAHEALSDVRRLAEQLNVSLEEAFTATICLKFQDLLRLMANSVEAIVRGTWAPTELAKAVEAGLITGNAFGGSSLVPEEPENADDWLVFPVTVTTVGTPVQGPNIPVDFGTKVVVRQRRHTAAREGYVSNTQSGTSNDDTRVVLGNNDTFTIPIDNLQKFWFDADTADTEFELIMERRGN